MSSSASSEKARFREHAHGRENRTFTAEQKAAVDRIHKCKSTAFYEILAISRESSDGQIKKAYHKLSLATHPDKNGAPGADEAFKLVSKAFQVLSDPQKRQIYDQTGGDPESRMPAGGGGGGGRGFGGGGTPFGFRSAGGPMFENEISPEELFNMFFSGGMGGMGGMGGGLFGEPAFASFGGPGIRVHQFGGGPRVRRRPAAGTGQREEDPQEAPNLKRIFWQLLPLIIFFLLPSLSGLFSGSSDNIGKVPEFRMQHDAAFSDMRSSPTYRIPFFVKPKLMKDLNPHDRARLERRVENKIITEWNNRCWLETQEREQAIQNAKGFIFTDQVALEKARRMSRPFCAKLEEYGAGARRQ